MEQSESTDVSVPREIGDALDERDYLDPETFPIIERQMAAHFDYQIELFPELNRTWSVRRFFDVYSSRIREHFPIDDRIQEVILALKNKIILSMALYIALKRFLLVLCLYLIYKSTSLTKFLGTQDSRLGDQQYTDLIYWGVLLMIVGFKLLGMISLHFMYNMKVEAETSSAALTISTHISRLSGLFADLLHRINHSKHVLESSKQWADMSARLIKSCIWVARRVEHLEKFIQVWMWRVRRIHRLTILFGRLSAGVILGVFLFSFSDSVPEEHLVASVLAAIAVTLASVFLYRTPTNDIEKRFSYAEWDSFRKMGFHEHIADHVKFDKQELRDTETLGNARQSRKSE
ncbi:MAG: hypothetical protein RIC04_03740 [Parvibaculum sp.]|uniref:hypothetical protein n=1 Tax=Parvibaculum sp. TaxID=2024848 RepID=UPI0032EF0A1B